MKRSRLFSNRVLFLPIIVLTLVPAACARRPADTRAAIASGVWRGVLTVPGGELPFHFDIERDSLGTSAHLINGGERAVINDVRIEGDSLLLRLPAFNTWIRAKLENGALAGELTLIKRGGVGQIIPFRAEHGLTYRFFDGGQPPEVDLGGRWSAMFMEDEGSSYPAVGEFVQKGARLWGTFLTPTGDYRYLEGDVRGRELYLSCFDGGHAFLFRASVTEDGGLVGDFWSGTQWHETWAASRNANATLPDADKITYLKPAAGRFTFRFPDTGGHEVSLEDSRFDGKVVIVTIAGTWCPNCHDEAAFLSKLYSDNAKRGLEIVGLMYEHYRDFDRAARQVERFRDKFDIGYTLLVAGYSDKEAAAATLPMLNDVKAFPTDIYIDRTGKVRRIRTGISGPGTGEHYNAYKKETIEFVDTLLSEGK